MKKNELLKVGKIVSITTKQGERLDGKIESIDGICDGCGNFVPEKMEVVIRNKSGVSWKIPQPQIEKVD